MRPNLPFLSAASNAILKPGGLLRWKVRLVKDAELLLPLTEVMKIARLTSPLLDALCLSSPTLSLRNGRRPALLFHPNQPKNCILSSPLYRWLSFLVFLLSSRRSFIRPSALLSLPLNFMGLPPTFLPPLPLTQTKLHIPC